MFEISGARKPSGIYFETCMLYDDTISKLKTSNFEVNFLGNYCEFHEKLVHLDNVSRGGCVSMHNVVIEWRKKSPSVVLF